MDTATHPIEVRAICDGLLLADHTFTADQEHTAEAYFSSTVDYYRRTDPADTSTEVSIQMLRGEEVVYETTVTCTH